MIDFNFLDNNSNAAFSLTGFSDTASFGINDKTANSYQEAFNSKQPVVVSCINHQENINSIDFIFSCQRH